MSYPGSKAQAGVFQTIIGNMPPHSVYVEAFFGSGQIFWKKRFADRSYLIDKRADLLPVETDAEVPICGDALELLPILPLPADALVYCDPPYPLDTRQGRLYYEHELTDDQHAQLLTLLQRLNCRVMISGVHCRLYDFHLAGWRCVEYRTRWHRKTVTECLWCNFPEPQELHDWRFAGRNFRQRTALKRLQSRWLGKLSRMKPLQRGYVLNSIEQRYFRRAAGELKPDALSVRDSVGIIGGSADSDIDAGGQLQT